MALDWFSFQCRKPRPNQLLTNWTTQPNSYRSKTKVKVILLPDYFQQTTVRLAEWSNKWEVIGLIL